MPVFQDPVGEPPGERPTDRPRSPTSRRSRPGWLVRQTQKDPAERKAFWPVFAREAAQKRPGPARRDQRARRPVSLRGTVPRCIHAFDFALRRIASNPLAVAIAKLTCASFHVFRSGGKWATNAAFVTCSVASPGWARPADTSRASKAASRSGSGRDGAGFLTGAGLLAGAASWSAEA